MLLLHCVSGAYFGASGKRTSKRGKAICLLLLAMLACLMITLLFFEMCFAGSLQRIDALMQMVPLLVCVAGDVLLYRLATAQSYVSIDANGVPTRTRRRRRSS